MSKIPRIPISSRVQETKKAASSTAESKEAEPNEWKEKYDDLLSKFDTLRIKRAQDQEKLKDAERLKIQVEQLQENKKQMMEKIAELQKTKAAAEKEAKEAREEQLKHAEETEGLSETAEMAILDKETAEEKLEICMSELKETKDKLEEVTLELEVIKMELEGKGVGEDVITSYQYKQLEQQNEKLKEALLKLRDISAQDKTQLNNLQKELEKNQHDIRDFQKLKEKLTNEIAEFEAQIADLKEQVDDGLGSQEMVEKLTEKNLALEDRIIELQEALDEEEDLRDSNNQIIELKEEQVLELREEVDLAYSKISMMKQEFAATQETIADYESTIKKFRDLVSRLREEMNELRSKSEDSSLNQVQQQQQQVENIEFKIRFAEGKAFSRAIDMELRRLEVDQSQMHIALISKFMPEIFFTSGGDHDAIEVLLLIPRMMKKCEILEKQVLEKFQPIELKEVTKSYLNENQEQIRQQTFSKHLLFILISLQSILAQYEEYLKSCVLETFLKFGNLYPELAIHERTIDNLIELLKKDQLDETVQLEPLEKSLIYFQSLFNIHIADGRSQNHTQFLSNFVLLMKIGCEVAQFDSIIFQNLLSQNHVELDHIVTYLNDIQEFCKRIKRRITGDTKLKLEDSVENEIRDCGVQISRVVNSLKKIKSQINISKGEIRHDKLDSAAQDVGGLKFIADSLEAIMTICCQLSTGIQQGDYDFDPKKDQIPTLKENPIDLRAQIWKSQTKEIDTLKLKLESREKEVSELKRALKIKIDELSEMQIRKDLAEKKLATANKDADDRVVRLQGELDRCKAEFKEKELEFEKTLNHYQSEIESYVSEQSAMKKKVNILSKQHLMQNLVQSSHQMTSSFHVQANDGLVKDLRNALKRQIDDNTCLKLKLAEKRFKQNPLTKPSQSKPIWLLRAQGKENQIDSKQEKLITLQKKISDFEHEIRCFYISQSIWDFNRPIKAQIQEEELKKKQFLIEYNKLEKQVYDFIKEYQEGYQIETHFNSFLPPNINKLLSNDKPKLAATISLPKQNLKGDLKSNEINLDLTLDQLRYLHRKLL